MKTPKEKADELVEKFIQVQDNTEFKTTEENYEKCVNLNKDLGSDVDSYWKQLAIKSAIKAVDEIVDAIDWHEFETPNNLLNYYNEVQNELNKML